MKVNLVLAVLSFTALSSLALGGPRIDNSLRQVLQRANQNDLITVVALVRDQMPLPRVEHSPRAHALVEHALIENARVSQNQTLKRLMALRGTGSRVSVRSLWLFNALLVQLNARSIAVLEQDENLTELYADQPVRLIAPVRSAFLAQQTYTYGLEKIGVPGLRKAYPKANGEGVRMGILDTGIDASHPDLKGRVIAFKDVINHKDQPYDDHGHGTHVGGTISGGNASGTFIGVAPGVKLIIGKILSGSGSGTWAGVLEGMQWIADPDGNPDTNDFPTAVSNSWGGGAADATKDPMDEPLCKAVAGWVKLGMVPVFAAGNAGPRPSTISLPGACPLALTIGATDENDAVASFSSRGPAKWKTGEFMKPIVSAPGVKVLSSLPGGKYDSWSGTSMATPHVSGLVAILRQAAPDITVENAVKIIASTSKPIGNGPNNDAGSGRVDVLKAIMNTLLLRRN